MRSFSAALYLALAVLAACCASATAYPVVVEAQKPVLSDPIDRGHDLVASSNLYCLALAVYFEGGSTGESEEGQRHIAHVVVARARANRQIWGGSNICDVVFHKVGKICQFSFACLPAAERTVRGGAAWRFSRQVASDELAGRGGIEERSLRYYMNVSLSQSKHACRFRKEFVPVIQAGRHEFFREATRAERRELAKGDYAECRKHEASLKKKKHAGKNKNKGEKLAKNDKDKKSGKKVAVARR